MKEIDSAEETSALDGVPYVGCRGLLSTTLGCEDYGGTRCVVQPPYSVSIPVLLRNPSTPAA